MGRLARVAVALSTVAAALGGAGCQGYTVLESEVSECQGDFDYGMVDPAALVETDSHQVTIEWTAAMNCCGPVIDITRDGDVLRVSYSEGASPCDCFCLYTVRYVLDIEAGDYTLVFVGDDWVNAHAEVPFTVPG